MAFHVAVIPDGNRRWARSRRLPAFEGHEAGRRALETLLDTIIATEIDWFTFWGASYDNLTKRSPEEVAFLDAKFAEQFRRLATSEGVHRNRIRVHVIGEWASLTSEATVAAARAAMAATAAYADRHFVVLLAYDGVRDMIAAVQRLLELARADPSLTVKDEAIRAHLATADLPDVDLLVRTGGEPHNSAGFLMWQTANAQLLFSEKLWPDFTPQDLLDAVAEFRSRQRRFGA